MTPMLPRITTLSLLYLVSVGLALRAEDWPRWRGPRGDGTWEAPKLPERWPAEGLRRLWRQPVGGGYAGITVAGGRVYTMDRVKFPGKPKPEDPDGEERVLCYDAEKGDLLWSHKYPSRYGNLGGYSNGPRAAPTFHEGRLYTLGAVGHFHCFDAATGKIHWEKDLVRSHKAKVTEWGFAAAPVVDEGRVVVHVGATPNGSLLAFDRLTGADVWRSLSDPAGYCTPILITSRGGRQLIAWTPENVHGLDPRTGKVHWTVPYAVTYGVAIATPVFRDDTVFVTGYWEGAKAIRLGDTLADAKLVWEENRHLRGLMSQPLYRDGLLYSLDKGLGLVCAELKTGSKVWDDGHRMTPRGRNPQASLVWLNDGDRALILNSAGELILARLNRAGYQEQARTKILDGQVWGHPAFAGNKVYAKSDGGEGAVRGGPYEIVCVELPRGK